MSLDWYTRVNTVSVSLKGIVCRGSGERKDEGCPQIFVRVALAAGETASPSACLLHQQSDPVHTHFNQRRSDRPHGRGPVESHISGLGSHAPSQRCRPYPRLKGRPAALLTLPHSSPGTCHLQALIYLCLAHLAEKP